MVAKGAGKLVATTTNRVVDDAMVRRWFSPARTAYNGFVLGLLVELRGRYLVRSNRESGFGRYDVMLVPTGPRRDPGVVMEFKVRDPEREATLKETVGSAHAQMAERAYARELVAVGVPPERIREYGLAFEGKHVLIG